MEKTSDSGEILFEGPQSRIISEENNLEILSKFEILWF